MDVESWKPGKRAGDRRQGGRFSLAIRSRICLQGDYRVQAVLNRYERFTLERRPQAVAAARPGRRAGLEPQAWQSLFEAPIGSRRGEASRAHPDQPRARPGDPAGRGLRAEADQLRALPAHPQRAAVEVLGPRHLPRGLGAPALGIRRASGGPLSAGDRARAFPGGTRWIPGNAAGSGSQAGLQQAIPARGL